MSAFPLAKFLSPVKLLSKWGPPLAILIAAIFALVFPGVRSRVAVEGVAAATAAPVPAPKTHPDIGADTGADAGVSAPASTEPVASADLLGLSGRLRAVMGTRDVLVQNPLLKPLLAESSEGVPSWPKLLTSD